MFYVDLQQKDHQYHAKQQKENVQRMCFGTPKVQWKKVQLRIWTPQIKSLLRACRG